MTADTGSTRAPAILLWTPPVAWMAVLFLGSASSGPPGGVAIPDWVTHGTAYLVLAVLLARALARGRREAVTPAVAVLAVVLSTAYGVTDEYHQSFVPGRDPSAADVAKDLGGSVLGVLLCRRYRLRRNGSPGGTKTRGSH